MNKINIVRWAGLGDVLMGCGVAKALKHQIPNVTINFQTNPAFHTLLEGCPSIDTINEGVGEPHVNLSQWTFGTDQKHQIDSYLSAWGLVEPDPQYKSIDLLINPDASARVDRWLESLPTSSKRVVLHPAISDPNRTIPVKTWQAIADSLTSEGYTVIQIGLTSAQDNKSVFELARVVSAINVFNLIETTELFRKCHLLITTDTGPVQLAGATQIPILGIYSVVYGNFRKPFRDAPFVALDATCPMANCYSLMHNPQIWEANFTRSLGETFIYWCPAGSKYSCLRKLHPQVIIDEALRML